MPSALRLRLLLPLTLAILAIPALATTAQAGTYDVYACRTPAGPESSLSAWTGTGSGFAGAYVQNYCANAGYFGGYLDQGTIPGNHRAQWLFEAPANTEIRSYVIYRIATSANTPGGSKNYDAFEDEVSFDTQHLIDLCFANAAQPCTTLGNPNAPMSEQNRLARTGRHAHRLFFISQCFSYNTCGKSGPAGFAIYQAQIGLGEDSPPSLSPVSGDFATSGHPVSGTGTLSFDASDTGGGVERVDLLADGVPVATESMEGQGAGCRRPFAAVIPCPASLSVELPLDTTRLPDGLHRLQGRAIDAAGNVGLSTPVFITTKNSTAPVIANGAGADRRARLAVSFGGRTVRTVRFNHSSVAAGHLTAATGQPIAGAYVGIYARVTQAGARWRGVGIVRTGSAGRFRWRARRGASRAFRFVYRAYSSDRRPASARTLQLHVRAGIRLSISPRSLRNGHTATFRVHLLGGPNRKGTLVSVQVLRPQRTTFATRGAGPDGVARVRHLFRYTYQPTTYFFRAVVQSQRGYPYLGAASHTVRFHVRP